jgi:hypothetical protein
MEKRWGMALEGLDAFYEAPLIGTGPKEEGYHNTYIDLLTQYGLMGVGPLALLIGYIAVIQMGRLRLSGGSRSERSREEAVAILLSIMAWMLVGGTIGAQKELAIWVVLGIGLAKSGETAIIFSGRVPSGRPGRIQKDVVESETGQSG